MNKIWKKAVCLLAIFVLCVPMTACGGNNERKQPVYDPQSSTSIKVVVKNLGFGVDWAYDIAEAFMETHPGTSVTVEKTVVSEALISQLEAGSNVGDICMFNDDALWNKWRTGMMVQIDDVLESTPDGEEKTVYEKTNRNMIDAYRVSDGHFYSVPWINENSGFVYNKTSLNTLLGNTWELPKTTEELWSLCERIKTAGGYGFVWNGAYVSADQWMAQYNGIEKTAKYLGGYYLDGTEWKLSDNAQCVEQNIGYLRALENLKRMVAEYSHQYAENMTHIYAQSAWAGIPYAGDSKLSVFMPNGDWTYNETKDYLDETQAEVGFMRVPVLSEIVETLDLYTDGSTAFKDLSTAKKSAYDAKLRAVIDWVDGGETGAKPDVSDGDVAKIRAARQIIGGKSQAQAFIPSTSATNKREIAKEFLTFMASDIAVGIFSAATYGFSPFITN